MPTALYSNPPLADFILSEAPGQRSRDNVLVVQTGAAIVSGSLLKQITGGDLRFAMDEGSVGNPTVGTVTVAATAVPGVYTLTFTSATAFRVDGPDGSTLGTGAAGTAFAQGGVTFTLTAGTTAAVAGDTATFEVTPVGAVYEAYDGTGTASAVLYSHLPTKTGRTEAVAFTMDCEVKRSALTGLTAAAETSLRAVGIKVRGKAGVPGIHTPEL